MIPNKTDSNKKNKDQLKDKKKEGNWKKYNFMDYLG
jgi:hypothetical protein